MRRNYQKHTNANPLQRWLLRRFHACVMTLLAGTGTPSIDLRILDVGCGEGFVVDFLLKRGIRPDAVGLDAERSALTVASRLPGDFLEGSALALPFADDSFPVVLCLEVLEHLASPELALKEMARVSSGYVIASVPHQPFFAAANLLRGKNLGTWGDDPEHVHHWTAGQFLKLVGESLRVEKVVYPFPWVIIAATRRIRAPWSLAATEGVVWNHVP